MDQYLGILSNYYQLSEEVNPNWTAFYKLLVKYWRQLKTSNEYSKLWEFAIEYQIFEKSNSSQLILNSNELSSADLDESTKEQPRNYVEAHEITANKNKDKIVKLKKRINKVNKEELLENRIESIKHTSAKMSAEKDPNSCKRRSEKLVNNAKSSKILKWNSFSQSAKRIPHDSLLIQDEKQLTPSKCSKYDQDLTFWRFHLKIGSTLNPLPFSSSLYGSGWLGTGWRNDMKSKNSIIFIANK